MVGLKQVVGFNLIKILVLIGWLVLSTSTPPQIINGIPKVSVMLCSTDVTQNVPFLFVFCLNECHIAFVRPDY